jgi:hypothetical protein
MVGCWIDRITDQRTAVQLEHSSRFLVQFVITALT